MAFVSKFVLGSVEADVKDAGARDLIGDLSDLTTSANTDIVSAINEVVGDIPAGASYDSVTETITL